MLQLGELEREGAFHHISCCHCHDVSEKSCIKVQIRVGVYKVVGVETSGPTFFTLPVDNGLDNHLAGPMIML